MSSDHALYEFRGHSCEHQASADGQNSTYSGVLNLKHRFTCQTSTCYPTTRTRPPQEPPTRYTTTRGAKFTNSSTTRSTVKSAVHCTISRLLQQRVTTVPPSCHWRSVLLKEGKKESSLCLRCRLLAVCRRQYRDKP